MKLLFDHNLSRHLVRDLADLFADSTHVSLIGLERADDGARLGLKLTTPLQRS